MLREILSRQLFIGNARDARDLRLLHDHEISAVLDLAIDEPPAQLSREMTYCRVPLMDGEGNSDSQISLAIHTLLHLLASKQPILVACSGGMSRSPAICAAALAIDASRSCGESLSQVLSDGPSDVSPALWKDVLRVTQSG
jgi:protein-tyrosine phosphatase